jgi:hypothetical protein
MHGGNFMLISSLNKGLTKIIRKFALKDPKLVQAVRRFFETMIRKYPRYKRALRAAMENIIKIIKRAKTKDEVLALLELRPFHPKLSTWKSIVKSVAGRKPGQ